MFGGEGFNNQEVTAGWMDLLRQSSMTAASWFWAGIKEVELYEQEACVKIPDDKRIDMALRIAGLAERDFHTSSLGIAAQKISASIDELASAIRAING